MEEQIAEWLYDGAVALQKGDRLRAFELLMKVVEHDQHSEEGWLWLSGAVENPEDQKTALLNVLDLNPHNEVARRGLEWLEAHT